ncbi:TIGR01459 family HAD-type hydrolase [Ollibium composti]|uniref:TIGR01459 family HAD-type hydrolase n=1 Tax=Ollibium composti TaxID=2675109 RepID=A0ABY2Q5X1_9HYPH|nr:TIGR01459 family HAD-type hydrolase [Mesorhizobium composti]THF56384.1 TIGR01459 family HAD-type hydrolase [Mesorhizobium composti]
MTAPIALSGIGALADRFDVFFIDQFGVLHDGTAPYPGAVDALARLTASGKTTALLSNSGKRSAPNEARLVKLGFKPGSWSHFLSSGEVAWRQLADAGQSGRRCLLVARDGDTSAVDGLPLQLVDDGAQADVVLLSASESDRHDLAHYQKLLGPAARRGVPCLCTNPDKIMLTPSGPSFGAGRIAELYAELGGSVTWIGKPFPEIYTAALALAGNPDPARVVCVGDSVEHDIAGGAEAGLATALVETGILATSHENERRRLYERYGVVPGFTLPGFYW